MAYLDINKFNILELLPVSFFPEEKKEDYLYEFSVAFIGYLLEYLKTQIKPEEAEEVERLMEDEDATEEEVQQFFRRKFPQYEERLEALSAKFKKDYLLVFYQKMIDALKKINHPTLPLWEEVLKEAKEDNWLRVEKLIREIEEKDQKEGKNPPSVSGVPPPPTLSF